MRNGKFLKLNWLRVLFFSAASMTCLYVFATSRTVSIPADSGTINLLNGSSEGVTYNMTCYSSSGAVATSYSNVTLNPKAGTNYSFSSNVTCNNGANVANWATQSMILCNSSTNAFSADDSCPTSYHLCLGTEFATIANSYSISTVGWISSNGFSNPYGYSYNSGSNYNSISLASGNPIGTNMSSYYCNSTGTNGAGTIIHYCSYSNPADSHGSFCCGSPVSASSCEITVTTGGFLQSKQFKNNAPF